jgi:hypothetical protein
MFYTVFLAVFSILTCLFVSLYGFIDKPYNSWQSVLSLFFPMVGAGICLFSIQKHINPDVGLQFCMVGFAMVFSTEKTLQSSKNVAWSLLIVSLVLGLDNPF